MNIKIQDFKKTSNCKFNRIDFPPAKKFDHPIYSSEEEPSSDTSNEVEVHRILRHHPVLSNDKSESDEDNVNDNNDIQDKEWFDPVGNQPQLISFVDNSGLKLSISNMKKVEYFYSLFVTEEIFEEIAKQTNFHAKKLVLQKQTSHLNEWHPTTKNEIKRVFGLIIWMGLVKLPELYLYWVKDPTFVQTFPRSIMPRNRFELLIQTLYFMDEEKTNLNDCLYKIRPIIDTLNKNFIKYYNPPEGLCINKSVIPLHDRIAFKQHINQKMHKYNIKIYKLCFKSGYTYNFQIHCDKESDMESTIPTSIFTSLCQNIFEKGHTIYTDSWCTSVELAQKLIAKNTHLVGTIQPNSHGISKEVVSKKLKQGKMFAKEDKNGITLLKWKDKHDVLLLSTKHSIETVVIKKKGDDYVKPKLISDYNKEKTSVDISEHMIAYCNLLQRNVKWFRKLAFELLLNTSVVNAWITYTNVRPDPISIIEFKKQLAIYLSHCHDEDDLLNYQDKENKKHNLLHWQKSDNKKRNLLYFPNENNKKHKLMHSQDKDNENHDLPPANTGIPKNHHEITRNINRRSRKRGRCVLCYKQNVEKFGTKYARYRSKQVSTFCDDCPDKPYLCIECFDTIHNTPFES